MWLMSELLYSSSMKKICITTTKCTVAKGFYFLLWRVHKRMDVYTYTQHIHAVIEEDDYDHNYFSKLYLFTMILHQ